MPRRLLLGFAISCLPALGQYTITTFAGGGVPQNIPGVAADLGSVNVTAVDDAGNVFITSNTYHVVWRLDAKTGLLILVAGNGTWGLTGDNGPATSAQLIYPNSVAVDAAGNLYITDVMANTIRKVSASGIITTVAGNGTQGFSGDNGLAINAALNPSEGGVAVDSGGNLFIADGDRIRKVSNGVITTVAGNGTAGFSGDNGPATSAQLNRPTSLAVDSAGNLYIADIGNNRVRQVSNGVITTVAGTGTAGFSGDGGLATSAQLNMGTRIHSASLAVDASASLYIADDNNNRVRKVSNGIITTVTGSVGLPCGDVAVDSSGNLYVSDYSPQILKVSSGVISTVVGGGSSVGDNGPATSADVRNPSGVAVDALGNLYAWDGGNRIRKVSNGLITTVAGNGNQGFNGDGGPATSAWLNGGFGVAVDASGNLYITDNNRIRIVSNGVITTVAGNGAQGFSGDGGPATSAQLNGPSGVAIDRAGNLYIADGGNNRIRMVSNGVITTVAGNGTIGLSGDNGPATGAQLSGPGSVAVDPTGNLFIADSRNFRIRKVSKGVITTVVGNGPIPDSGDNGPAIDAGITQPYGIAVDGAENLYIAEGGCGSSNGSVGSGPTFYGCRIRKVSNGVISTIAGNGPIGFSGDNGPAASAQFALPNSVAVDAGGKVYVADSGNNRIRILIPLGTTPAITGINNAASNKNGPIAPGEIVVLTGSGLGPAQLTSGHVGSDGLYDAQLAGTTIMFNGTPAPMIYTWASQIAAIVPYEVSGTAQVTLAYQGQTSASFSAQVAPSAPGVFTLDSTGLGQAAVVNQNGSINTAATPAKVGDIISIYATGEGQTTPSGSDGEPATLPYPHPNLPVSVTIGGQTLTPIYAGGAPGEVAGLMQINVQIPAGIQVGSAVPVLIQVGSASSQSGVTIAVSGN